jgi:RimJ/RimL family protein N-acetyltransferase
MASVTLRELVRSDWPALRDIRLHALRTEPGVFFSRYADEAVQADEHWMALATGDEKHQLFGLFAGEELVGISRVSVDRNDPSGATAELGMSYIAPEYRGRGLAGQLYEARLAWVRARPQFVRVVVGHRRSNEPSRRAIERFGFRWVGDRPHRWPDGSDEDYVDYELLMPETRGRSRV